MAWEISVAFLHSLVDYSECQVLNVNQVCLRNDIQVLILFTFNTLFAQGSYLECESEKQCI